MELIELELRLNQLQDQCDAQQLVLAWLLSKQPDDEAMRFLSAQANSFEDADPLKWEAWIAELDDLRSSVAVWRDQHTSSPRDSR